MKFLNDLTLGAKVIGAVGWLSLVVLLLGIVSLGQLSAAGAGHQAAGGSGWTEIAGILAFALLSCAGAGAFLIGAVARPIQHMTAIMARLAKHDLSADVDYAGRADEIGQMADAVQVFKDSMIEGRPPEGRAGRRPSSVAAARSASWSTS